MHTSYNVNILKLGNIGGSYTNPTTKPEEDRHARRSPTADNRTTSYGGHYQVQGGGGTKYIVPGADRGTMQTTTLYRVAKLGKWLVDEGLARNTYLPTTKGISEQI